MRQGTLGQGPGTGASNRKGRNRGSIHHRTQTITHNATRMGILNTLDEATDSSYAENQ